MKPARFKWRFLQQTWLKLQEAKHVVVNIEFAKDESSILSTSNQTKGFSLTTEAFCF